MDESPRRPFDPDGLKERALNKVRGDPRSQGIADDLSVEEVLVGGAVEPAFFCRDIRDVAHPDLVWCRHLELLFHEVCRHGQGMCRIGRRPELLRLGASYPELRPDPPYRETPTVMPWAARSFCNLSGPQVWRVLLWAALISASSRPFFPGSSRWRPREPFVVAAWGYLEERAHPHEGIREPHLSHDRVPRLRLFRKVRGCLF